MATDAKSPTPAPLPKRERGLLIFTYPKIMFIFPTLIMALVCWVGMIVSGNKTELPSRVSDQNAAATKTATKTQVTDAQGKTTTTTAPATPNSTTTSTTTARTPSNENFRSPQNMLGLLFLLTFFFNLLIIAIDFPRFTVVAVALLATTVVFFLLWLGIYVNWLTGIVRMLEGIYVSANATFYLMVAIILGGVYGLIFLTRWLDYWEVLPNEILHHHGPWSDLERLPTMYLKFDKEIPDIFEHIMFGSGRLVLRVPNQERAIVLDNVLHVNKKEEALKMLMSRMEVRVTTDQEVGNP